MGELRPGRHRLPCCARPKPQGHPDEPENCVRAVRKRDRRSGDAGRGVGEPAGGPVQHSTRCPVSAVVTDEVLRFARTHPDWTIYVLKVIERRDLSDLVTERLGVPHASPQAFVIRHGRCVWHASHYEVTAQSLSRHLA